MPKRRAGALLIITGVVLALVTTAVAIIDGIAAISVDPGYLLLVACVGLVGLGVALLSVSGPIFGGTLARRALKILAFGLVGCAVTLGLVALPGFQSIMLILFIPGTVIGWATMIGAVLTVVALLTAGGRPRQVGATFLVAAIAFFAFFASEDTRLLAIAFGALAGGALLLGFVGLALLGLDSEASTVVESTGEGNIG